MFFKRKIFIIICLLLFALPVGFASDDANLNQTLSTNEMDYAEVLSSEDDDYIHIYVNASAASPGNGTQEAPYQNLSSVNYNFTNNTVLHIADGYYNYNNSGNTSMLIFSNVKFIGESTENTTLDFSGNGIFAFIEYGSNIYFENIRLFNTPVNLISYNGQRQYGGKFEGVNVTFENSKSIASNGVNYIGGAISCSGELKLTNCIFKNNSADLGGAIFALIGGEITNCTFINNTAKEDGGAIFTPYNKILIFDSSFINNTALDGGGAIYTLSYSEITNCTFINNTAKEDGGAIFASNDETLISDSSFINNTALDGGGAIYAQTTLSIIHSNFTYNYALHGGAITSVSSPSFYLNDVNFINNSAELSAGAIYSMFSKNYFYDSYFINCSSLIGGAICDLNSFSVFSGLNFKSNKATKGGAIYKMYNTISINDSTFISNRANDGGGLYIDWVDSAILNNLSLNSNAADYGRDIYCLGNISNINITNVFSPDLFNVTFVDLIQRDGNYDIFEINDDPVVFDSRYDMRVHGYLTEVKDQETEGNCWAFASIAALESCILKANGTAYDFSEENLKNIVAMFSDYGNLGARPNSGGNLFMAIGYFASWLGPVYEKDDVYSSNALSLLYDAVTHIQNVLFIPRTSSTDNDNIKEAIMKYGAVVVNMFYSDAYLSNDGISYYLPSYNGMNHEVTIVGWDDNYSKEKFNRHPPGNGAFIVRNSWGPDWGENGYFYVSYYDASFARNTIQPPYTFVFNDTNHYDKNYQHEIQISNFNDGFPNPLYIGNSFVAEDDELISAVSTYFSDYSNYTINIYVNANLKHSQSGSVPSGYSTISLTKYVPVKENDTFDIIFEIKSLNQPRPLLYFFNYGQNSRIAQKGVSFYSRDGKTWYDAGYENVVLPIKGFTKYGKLNTTLEVSGLDSYWTVNKDVTLVAKVKNEYGDYINEGNVTFWIDGVKYSVALSNYTANKTVSFNQLGKYNLTVLFDNVYYYYPSNVISQLININPAKTTLSLSLGKNVVFVGDSFSVKANVNASQGKVKFYLNNVLKGTVDVNSKGVAVLALNGLSYGNYTITAEYTDEKGYYLNSSNKTTFNIFIKSILEVSGLDSDWTINKNFNLVAKVKDQFGDYINEGSVSFLIDGVKYTVGLSNYVASTTVSFSQAGKHNITVLFNPVKYYYPSNVSKLINIDPIKTVLSLSLGNGTLFVGDSLSVRANVNATQGKVMFYLNDVLKGTVNVNSKGVASLVLNGLSMGNNKLTARYTDDKGTYLDSSAKAAFDVFMKTTLVVSGLDSDWTINKNFNLVAKVKDQFGSYINEGSVTFLIDGVKYTVGLSNYAASKTVSFSQAGKHNITVLFNQVKYYYPSNVVSKLINIDPVKTVLSLSLGKDVVFAGDSLSVKASVNASQGKVMFYLNNVLKGTVNVDSKGVASLVLKDLSYGTYNLNAKFSDDKGTYLDSSDKATFDVFIKTILEVSGLDSDWVINKDVNLVAKVKDQFGGYINEGSVSFLIDGVKYAVGLSNYAASKTVSFSQAGKHNITVLFNLVKFYYPSNVVSKLININPVKTALSLSLGNGTLFVGDSLSVRANVNASQGKVMFYINDVLKGTVNVDSKGMASLVLNGLSMGNNKLTARYMDDKGTYLDSSAKAAFDVFMKTALEVSGLDSDWVINKDVNLVAKVKDQFGGYINEGSVSFLIDGVKYAVGLSNYAASKSVSFSQAGKHNITVLFNLVKFYYPSNVVSKLINIDPVKTALSLSLSKDVLFVGDSLSVKAGVNATQGKVMFYLNDVLKGTVNVDSKGMASIVLKDLSYGTYNLNAKFSDDKGTYLDSSSKTTFSVIYPIKIVTQNLKKYYNESDRFSARVYGNDGKIVSGQKVKFTINNNVYENITDSKGYAYLDIRLQPGNYVVKTSYKDQEVSNVIEILATLFDRDMQILPSDIYEGENEVIKVVLPKDATGTLNIKVNNKEYRVNLNKGIAEINVSGLKQGKYDVDAVYYGDSHYNSVKGKSSFTVGKSQINIMAPDLNIYCGSSEKFVVTLLNHDHPIVNANVKITLDGMEYTKITDGEGKASIDLNLKKGIYNVISEYGEYKKYSTINIHSTIISNDLSCDFINFYYNATFLDSNGKPLAKSKVSFIFDGKTPYTLTGVTNDDGVAYLTKDVLYSLGAVGSYNVKIINPITNDLNYNVISVSKTLTSISTEIVQNDEILTLLAKINPESVDGKVKFMVDGKEYLSDIRDGEAKLSIPNLYSGTYTVNASYAGNNYFKPSVSDNIPLIVSNIHIYAPDVSKYYGGSERLVVTLKDKDRPISNAAITININNFAYKRTTNNEGTASMAINLNSGVYNATIEYNGTKVQSTVVVKNTVISNDISKIYRNATQYYATFLDSKGNLLKKTPVKFNINGVFYIRNTNEEGVARLNINLNPDVYILTAYNPSSGEQHSNTITVLSNIVENNDLTKYYKNESKFTFRLLDSHGRPVGAGVSATLNINGVFYVRSTNASGYVNMNINLNPGTYIVTIEYNGLMRSNTIKVLPILKAKDLYMKYNDGSKFEVTLLDGKGNPFAGQYLTFNINGVFYKRLTDSNGIARLNVRLMAGQYIISSMYDNGAIISNKITISA